MSARLDRWLTRLYRAVGCALFLALCAVLAYTAGDGLRRSCVRSAGLPTSEVAPGGVLRQAGVIADGTECALRYAHRFRGAGADGHRLMLPAVAFEATPCDRDGKPRTAGTEIPADIPGGPGMIAESPSAAFDPVRRTGPGQHRPDPIAPSRETRGERDRPTCRAFPSAAHAP